MLAASLRQWLFGEVGQGWLLQSLHLNRYNPSTFLMFDDTLCMDIAAGLVLVSRVFDGWADRHKKFCHPPCSHLKAPSVELTPPGQPHLCLKHKTTNNNYYSLFLLAITHGACLPKWMNFLTFFKGEAGSLPIKKFLAYSIFSLTFDQN